MAPPTSDEILAAEYLRFTAASIGAAAKESVADWNIQNPLHPRGPDGRYIDTPGLVAALGDMPEGEPGARTVRRAVRNRPLEVRPALARLRTKAAVQTHLRDELRRVLGRDVGVDLGTRMHVSTMRELAEGFLRGAEDWQGISLERISVASRLPGSAPDAWSATTAGPRGPEIVLNERQLGNRTRFLQRLRRSVESGDNRPTSDNAAYVSAHEFGHVALAQFVETPGRSSEVGYAVLRAMPETAIDDPGQRAAYIAGQLGSHTLHSQREMGAEGLADVILNDDNAAPMSLAIHRAARQAAGDPSHAAREVEGPERPPTPTGPRLPTPATPAAQASPPRRRASARLRVAEALNTWAAGRGGEDPLAGFDREPLRRVAVDYGIQLRRGAPVEEIRQALLDHTRRTVRDPAQGRTVRSLDDLLEIDPQAGERSPWGPPDPRIDDIRAAFEGEFAGLRTRVTGSMFPSQHNSALFVDGDILDANGVKVGRFSQEYGRDRNGKLIAHHGLMELEPHAQGSGFATIHGMHLLNQYREWGIAELHTLANIDVGGYTWARGGFDFADTAAARGVINRLEQFVNDIDYYLRGTPNIAEQKQAARELIDRARNARTISSPDYPTAFEISQLGRWDGAGKNDMWIGKQALLGSTWEAVLRL